MCNARTSSRTASGANTAASSSKARSKAAGTSAGSIAHRQDTGPSLAAAIDNMLGANAADHRFGTANAYAG
jgi:hypothetical protein